MSLIVKQQLLDLIEADRENLVTFLSRFLQAKSPNPPGDTRLSCDHVTGFLRAEGLTHEVVAPQETMPNIIAMFEGAAPGPHLVLNGHMDVFPEQEVIPGERDQWSGDIEDGKVYGRGASDMKCGTTAAIFAYRYLHSIRDQLKGRLSLTVVSDEETGGRWGTRYLLDNHADVVKGDCALISEPTGVHTIRYGEKGSLRLTLTARTKGAHGAYPHVSACASKIIARLAVELERLEDIPPDLPADIAAALSDPEAVRCFEASLGEGAADVARRVTVNIGILKGGVKVNVMPDLCEMQLDIRLPIGISKERVQREIDEILTRYPEVTAEEHIYHSYPSSVCDPKGAMVGFLQNNAAGSNGIRPVPIVSLGGSDARYWRWLGVNAYLYGCSPKTMGRRGEHVEIDEFMHIVRTLTLSAYDYLTQD